MLNTALPLRIEVIDSHTAGEPTRCVLSGGPHLGTGPIAGRLEKLRAHHDVYRRAILCEPRGSEVLVGALLLEPVDPAAAAAVIFFNNAGYLGMCGHGMIGVAATLSYLGRIFPGKHLIETPVGDVTISLDEKNEVTVSNVEAYRYRVRVPVELPGYGVIHGDVAWGGNWFFLVQEHGETLDLAHAERLTDVTWRIRQALTAQGITGEGGGEIDHIELFGPPTSGGADSKNFVLCPGKAYDRSPCGTGTSAKLACLYAEGKLRPGDVWRQESIVGSVFEGSITVEGGRVLPEITGYAYINAEADLILDERDPFCHGIPSSCHPPTT